MLGRPAKIAARALALAVAVSTLLASAAAPPGRPMASTVLLTNTQYRYQGAVYITPAIPGFYSWLELSGGVSLGPEDSWLRPDQRLLVLSPPGASTVCRGVLRLGVGGDATPALRHCIDETPTGGVVEVPAGTYSLLQQIVLNRDVTLKTLGVRFDDAPCSLAPSTCATFVIAPTFFELNGIFTGSPGTRIMLDHLVVDGNRALRRNGPAGEQCLAGENRYGQSMTFFGCEQCYFTGSTSKNALCGTGMLSHDSSMSVVASSFVKSGDHLDRDVWSDGLTVGLCRDSHIINNDFVDNTDVQLIVGGAKSCTVTYNRLSHSNNDPRRGAFVDLMLYSWLPGDTSFGGSEFAHNSIDCRGNCGAGIFIGADFGGPSAPYLVGGSVHDNRVRAARQGIAVDKAREMTFYDNFVTDSGGLFQAQCGSIQHTAYSVSAATSLIRDGDSVPSSAYVLKEWDYCIPHWFW